MANLKNPIPKDAILFSDRHPEYGQYITSYWEDGSICDALHNGLDLSITPLPTHWEPLKIQTTEEQIQFLVGE